MNPVIKRPPVEWDVVGFRDPYVFKNNHLDQLMRRIEYALHPNSSSLTNEFYYMLLGSGLRNRGSAAMLYVSKDTVHWDSLPLPFFHESYDRVAFGVDKQKFYFGRNAEMCNLAPLGEYEGSPVYILTFGVEGIASPFAGNQHAVYALGKVELIKFEEEQELWLKQSPFFPYAIQFKPVVFGRFDYGNLYALSHLSLLESSQLFVIDPSFDNPDHIILGWINEDVNENDRMELKSAGCVGIPRTVKLGYLNGLPVLKSAPLPAIIKKMRNSAIFIHYSANDIEASNWASGKLPPLNVSFVSYKPLSLAEAVLRPVADEHLCIPTNRWRHTYLLEYTPPRFELIFHIDSTNLTQHFENGLIIHDVTSPWSQFTPILFSNSHLVIVRTFTRSNSTFPSVSVPFLTVGHQEIRIIYDHGLLEIFVNDETSASVRLNPKLTANANITLGIVKTTSNISIDLWHSIASIWQ